jgi:hypothetical protein
MQGNSALPGGSSKSKPAWWNAFKAFHHAGFFSERKVCHGFAVYCTGQ